MQWYYLCFGDSVYFQKVNKKKIYISIARFHHCYFTLSVYEDKLLLGVPSFFIRYKQGTSIINSNKIVIKLHTKFTFLSYYLIIYCPFSSIGSHVELHYTELLSFFRLLLAMRVCHLLWLYEGYERRLCFSCYWQFYLLVRYLVRWLFIGVFQLFSY